MIATVRAPVVMLLLCCLWAGMCVWLFLDRARREQHVGENSAQNTEHNFAAALHGELRRPPS
jgi:hypothetical protein